VATPLGKVAAGKKAGSTLNEHALCRMTLVLGCGVNKGVWVAASVDVRGDGRENGGEGGEAGEHGEGGVRDEGRELGDLTGRCSDRPSHLGVLLIRSHAGQASPCCVGA
jgi:hypothetical protein